MKKQGYVYIITNKNNNVLYTGVTSEIRKRIYQHKEKLIDGFSKKYNLNKLVYFECYDEMTDAIAREKQIKAGSRKKKEELINKENPKWIDLYNQL